MFLVRPLLPGCPVGWLAMLAYITQRPVMASTLHGQSQRKTSTTKNPRCYGRIWEWRRKWPSRPPVAHLWADFQACLIKLLILHPQYQQCFNCSLHVDLFYFFIMAKVETVYKLWLYISIAIIIYKDFIILPWRIKSITYKQISVGWIWMQAKSWNRETVKKTENLGQQFLFICVFCDILRFDHNWHRFWPQATLQKMWR